MRICYLADPTSSHTVKWLAYFLQRDYEVHLLGWDRPIDPALAEVHYHHLPDELRPPFARLLRGALWHLNLWPAAVFRQMQVILNYIQPDIFDILMLNASQIPAALAWRGSLVITPWGHDLLVFPQHYSPITRLFLRLALHRANLVLCNSVRLERAARELGARPSRIRPVGQIVDLARFRPDLDGSALRAQLGISDRPILLSPRRLEPDYRIEVLIRALPKVLNVLPQAQLLLLGDRAQLPDYIAYLDVEIERLGVQDNVRFGGWYTNGAMPQVYALADVILSMPVSDSRPSSVFEAMACGVPVVVSDLASVREIVQDNETGLLAPVDDTQALAAAIIRVLSDKLLHKRIVAQALEFVRQEGDYETQMARVANYYDELMGC